ncbi:hypothetical protein K493DRAFT_293706 [Basidiobolus meristosporus CBS 931.73]|uniref:PH domain-containing protein n=1 Tax=Basidiobolus meristosporus CBS 931.73 TaxID=1314790 RepID=A0A1Y1WWG4_9FUNG|nr:hypothetical protein K493DRAFT_293706 [Basidiobolus meristosporus CBS 931.73]|eukprot:ORX77870.1 hypothetical protein K493DRAFT_293706 [Basidiobolus meristosporus CBS 931.73]
MSSICSSTTTVSQESLVHISRTLKRAYLTVRGAGIRNWMWTKRLIILKNIAITIHKHENEYKASEVIYINSIVDVVRCDLRPHSFKVLTTDKAYYFSCRNEEELSSWMDDIYKKTVMKGISNPTNFRHDAHLGFNPETGAIECSGKGFENIQTDSLTREDYIENPRVMLSLMSICTGQQKLHSRDEPDNSSVGYRCSAKPKNDSESSEFQLPEIPKTLSILFDDFEMPTIFPKTEVN